jgi:hypothetical protein
MKKGICSLSVLADCLKSANKRYIDFISGFDNRNAGRRKLEKIAESKVENNRNYKGFNWILVQDNTDTQRIMPKIAYFVATNFSCT